MTGKRRGRPPIAKSSRRGPRKGYKAAVKYRGPKGETWTGRGLQPRWMAELTKQGHKREEYAVGGEALKKAVRRKK